MLRSRSLVSIPPWLTKSSPEMTSTGASDCATDLGLPLVPIVTTSSIISGSACSSASAGCEDNPSKDKAVTETLTMLLRHRQMFNSFDIEVDLHAPLGAKLVCWPRRLSSRMQLNS